MLLWRSLKPSLIVAAAKSVAARSTQPVPEAPRVAPLPRAFAIPRTAPSAKSGG